MKQLLKLRRRMKKRKPDFKRQEEYRLGRLKSKWRRPRGRHSKLRIERKSRGRLPKPSYSSPKAVRGLDRQGRREVRVFNPLELEALDPNKESAVIGGTVGKRKREEIAKKARELRIKISNL